MISELLYNITVWFGELGYWGVFIACFGIFPAEVVISVLGAMRPHSLVEISLVAALGGMLGAIPTYLIGYYFRNKDLLKFLKGKGKFLNVSEESYNNAYESIEKKGKVYLFLTRFIPWIRVAATLVAGYVKYNVLILSGAVFAGTFIYAYGFAYIGAEIGFNWEKIKGIIDTYNNAMLVLIFLGIGIYVYVNRKKFFKK